MAVCIKKFIVVNNYGTIQLGEGPTDTSTKTSKSNNGATGSVIADFINGKNMSRTQGTTDNTMEFSEAGTNQATATNRL